MRTLSGGTLAIDIGGTGIKGMVLDGTGTPISERKRIKTPRPAKPGPVIDTILEVAGDQPPFERVSVGFPGVVVEGRTMSAPNLHRDWTDFGLGGELEQRIGRPVRVANDADIQGLGAVEGHGVEMVITLGTGMGSALFVDGRLVPNLELAHHPFKKKDTYEEYVGKAAFEKLGKKKWSKRVIEVIEQIQPIWNPRMLYIGGGNAKELKVELPDNVKVVENIVGILGGIKLWL